MIQGVPHLYPTSPQTLTLWIPPPNFQLFFEGLGNRADPGRIIIGFRMWCGEDGNYSEVLWGVGGVRLWAETWKRSIPPTDHPQPKIVSLPSPHPQRLMLGLGRGRQAPLPQLLLSDPAHPLLGKTCHPLDISPLTLKIGSLGGGNAEERKLGILITAH